MLSAPVSIYFPSIGLVRVRCIYSGQVRHGGGRRSSVGAASTNRLVTYVQKRRENMSVYSDTSDVRLAFGLEGTAARREREAALRTPAVLPWSWRPLNGRFINRT